MNKSLLTAAAITLSFGATVIATTPASADTATTTATNACKVVLTGAKNTANNSDSRFTLANDQAATQVVVTGTDCHEAVTIVSWQAPDGLKGQPYSAQKLYTSNTQTLTTGTHAMSVQLPDCYYQVDVVLGSSATDTKGGPEYGTNGNIQLIGSLHGGTQACVASTTPTGGKGGDTPTPVAAATTVTPTALPNTGSGSTSFVLAIGAAVAGAFIWNRRQAGKLVA